jgi:hypothetical protein
MIKYVLEVEVFASFAAHIRNHFFNNAPKGGRWRRGPSLCSCQEGSSYKQPAFKPCESIFTECNSFGIWKHRACLPVLQVMILAIRKNGVAVNKPTAIKQKCLHFVHSEQRFGLRWDCIILLSSAVKCLFRLGSSQTCHEHFQHIVRKNASLFEEFEGRIPSYYLFGRRIQSSELLWRAVRRQPDVSDEHNASIFRVEE